MSNSKQQYQNSGSSSTQQAAQRKGANVLVDNRPDSVQRQKSNNTGLPDNLKSGMESLSGMSLDHVKVHYNSSKPAAVQAHAYAQGSDIHLAPGQSHHLPHELGHVVQQAQGRVKPTTSVNGLNVNDNPALEHEATVMGNKALQRASLSSTPNYDHYESSSTLQAQPLNKNHSAQFKPIDGMDGVNYSVMSQDSYQLWQKSKQGTAQLHGKCVDGNKVVVTQFQDTAQQFSLGPKTKGLLLISEGVLTAVAGGVVIAATHGTLAIPGILSVCVGVSKFIRGVTTICLGNKKPTDGVKAKLAFALMDGLRTFEAGASIASAIIGGGNPVKMTISLVFGLAKSIRSICTAIADFINSSQTGAQDYPKLLGFVKKVAAIAHWVEVGAGTLSGGASLVGGNTVGGLTGLATAASKTVRAKDQHDKAWPKPEPTAPTETTRL
ncbi:eCIS core domain-containing protein [Pseudoalteromonas caenipelagi]|uniref:eCIS core domain-containing protein n=1 Tax=Pseudoalteromonas caenipelagi TaxID=2726988 RepID=UPI001FEC2D93|nr:DUF4157 domain-containing protein [Pseudoalteromonas caenipelagi]